MVSIRVTCILILKSFLIQLFFVNGAEWDYGKHGPDVWKEIASECGGSRQSPIDIRTLCSIFRSFTPFELSSAYNSRQNFKLVNNGHGITATQSSSSSYPLTLTGGGLDGVYQFVNFHLHWGYNHGAGSEHEVNGEKYASEVHFVHINPNNNHLAVLGFLIDSYTGSNQNTASDQAWKPFFTQSGLLNQTDAVGNVTLDLTSLMDSERSQFWRYEGSLTVPSCDERVTWTVFKEPIVLSDSFLKILRDNVMPLNYREPQPLNNRRVFRSFPQIIQPTISDARYCLPIGDGFRIGANTMLLLFLAFVSLFQHVLA